MKSWNEIRKDATAFSKRWKDAYDEKSQAQSFLKLYAEATQGTKETEETKGTRDKRAGKSLKSLQSLTSPEGGTDG